MRAVVFFELRVRGGGAGILHLVVVVVVQTSTYHVRVQ